MNDKKCVSLINKLRKVIVYFYLCDKVESLRLTRFELFSWAGTCTSVLVCFCYFPQSLKQEFKQT